MKIVDAIWEKRNLAVTCIEISIESNDKKEDIINSIKKIQAEYVVVRIPTNRPDIFIQMSDIGFVFFEGIVEVINYLKHTELNGIYKRLNENIYYKQMDEESITILFNELRKGIFQTDRISLDPYFSKEIAGHRYINWIKDEIYGKSEAFDVCYKNDVIGFFTFKEIRPNEFYPFLGGLYEKYTDSGLGLYVIYKAMEEAIKRNAKSLSSKLSLNNLPIIKIYSILGFEIKDINYVFIKHNNL